MKLKYSLLALSLISVLMVACNDSSTTGSSSNSNPRLQAVPDPAVKFELQPHIAGSQYYTAATNNANYSLYTVTAIQKKPVVFKQFELTGDTAAFALKTESALYPVGATQCAANLTLNSNESCAVLVALADPEQIDSTQKSARILVNAGGVKIYSSNITKTSYAYFGGDFSRNYGSGESAVAASGTGDCGPAYNKDCALIELNLANGKQNAVMRANSTIYNITIDKANATLYAAGLFTSATTPTQTATATSGSASGMIVANNPAVGTLTDVVNAHGGVYPDGAVLTLGFEHGNLYAAGAFTTLGTVAAVGDTYPVVSLNATTGTWGNVLATRPDGAVTALGFKDNRMFISGYYSNLLGMSAYTYGINSCTTADAGATYTCATGSAVLSGGTATPAGSLAVDKNDQLIAAGGFSQINALGADNSNYMLVSNSAAASLSSAWTAVISTNYPDAPFNTAMPYGDNLLAGGYFSSIGGIATGTDAGTCGVGAFTKEVTATTSCLLAKFESGVWSKAATTDSTINAVAYMAKIGG